MMDRNFKPAATENRNFLKAVYKSGDGTPLVIALENSDGIVSTFKTTVFNNNTNKDKLNNFYVERLVKSLIWTRGGWKITIAGSNKIGNHIKKIYSIGGLREFDAKLMGTIYGKPFIVEIDDNIKIRSTREEMNTVSYNLDGNRIGFDLGASDRKVSAVINGKPVFSEEIAWDPGKKNDPSYHYHEIMSMLHHAAAHLPGVDAIGGSSAGIYINNSIKVASLFRKVPLDLFEKKVKNMFIDIQRKWGVPMEVKNDGEVTALAASMSLKKNAILGIAMGSSEAGGYINKKGSLNPWLNELAFVPIDYNPSAPIDEWSGDRGCGAQYFSQQAVIRLSKKAKIALDNKLSIAEKLKFIQDLMVKGDERAYKIFHTIGYYLGFSIAHYSDLYDIENIYLLGRVTSGEGGQIIKKIAENVLNNEFPDLSDKITLYLPDESSRRVGQSIAAASLPFIK